MTSRLLDVSVDDHRPIVLGRDGSRVLTSSGVLLEAGGGSHATCIVNDRGRLLSEIERVLAETATVGSARAYVHAAQIELADRVARLWEDQDGRVYFTSGGSEAFETALRLVYHVHKLRGDDRRSMVVGHRFSYHGMTLAARNASDHPEHPPGPTRADFRWPKLSGADDSDIAEDEELLERYAQDIAAVIIEPVSGTTGGAMVRSAAYLQWLGSACRERGIILIIDEVVTAFGRTGVGLCSSWLKPDIILGGKCLGGGYAPIGCVLLAGPLCEELRHWREPLPLRLTFSANLTACAIATAVQRYCEQQALYAEVAKRGPVISDLLQMRVAERGSGFDIHGTGHLWGVHARLGSGGGRQLATKVKLLAAKEGIEFMGGGRVTGGSDSIHMVLTPPFDSTLEQLHELAGTSVDFFSRAVAAG
jgi:adenosylmethionine-8-amino-7-oxononanoate aminotransferase